MNEDRKAFTKLSDNEPIHISLAGITFPDSSYRITRSKAKVSVLEYVLDGTGYIDIDGKPVAVSKDQIYFLPSKIPHHYFADENTPFEKIFINISDTFLANQILTAYGLNQISIFDGIEYKNYFEQILNVIHSSDSEPVIQSKLVGILTEFLVFFKKNNATIRHNIEALKLKEYIDANTNRIVTIKELSNLIFRSSDYCLKLFRKEFGTTPYAYQLDQKLNLAKTLLIDTNVSIGEIAESIGYFDHQYFSNIFKKKTGLCPKQYRIKNK